MNLDSKHHSEQYITGKKMIFNIILIFFNILNLNKKVL